MAGGLSSLDFLLFESWESLGFLEMIKLLLNNGGGGRGGGGGATWRREMDK